jgi:hypothetical protein
MQTGQAISDHISMERQTPAQESAFVAKTSSQLKRKLFFDVVERYNVDYVFADQHHGYAKAEKNGTKFIITGGGGQRLDEVEHGKFHHIMRMQVKNGSVTDSVIATQRRPYNDRSSSTFGRSSHETRSPRQ